HDVVRTIDLPEGARPMGVELSPDGSRLSVDNGRGGTVAVFDTANDSLLAAHDVRGRPWGSGLKADRSRIYTANGASGDVTVLDAGTLSVITRIPTGELPWGIAIGPAM